MMKEVRHNDVLKAISSIVMELKPENGKIILFGSQARGDASELSDWDILILLDKDRIEESDHDKFTYPFWELGWKINAMIHPIIYTLQEWATRIHSPFHNNVESEGILLC